MQKNILLSACLLFVIACATSCTAVKFYDENNSPFYYSSKTDSSIAAQKDSLNVITFNIKKSEKIDLAITELKKFEASRNVDIYLLQEMNEQAVQEIAKSMNLNYLYIPIVYDRSDKKNIGNAILTRGTIERPEKYILPHAKWQNQQRRDITIGEVNIHQKKILVYGVHTETFAMSRNKRIDQVNAIIEHAKQEAAGYQYVLIGGDFNTMFPGYGKIVVNKFTGSGFDWATSSVGTTATAAMGLVKPRHDYIFSKGLKLSSAFKIDESKSSDHYPVFASFMF